MQAVIMAGGYGTRLKPLTNDLPKPMVPIIDKPIIHYIIKHLKKYGVRDIIITLGYKPERITDYLGDGTKYGVKIRYCVESVPLGTAGGVKNVADMIDDTFIIISGDALTNINIDRLVHHHIVNEQLVTMAVKEVADPRGFGVVRVDDDSNIVRFIEKPPVTTDKLVNTGIYVMERAVLDLIPDGRYDFSCDLFPRIMREMTAFQMTNFWSDIGTLSSYYLANNYVALHPERFDAVLG